MKRITAIGLIIAAAVGSCVVAAYFSSYYYNLYLNARTDLEYRCEVLEQRVAYLETHKPRSLIPIHAWGEISTTDHPLPFAGTFVEEESRRPPVLFVGKGNGIRPELRIPAGSTERHVFDIQLGDGRDVIADVWLSHGGPSDGLAALEGLFEEFRAYRPRDTNVVRLVVQAKPNTSMKLRFSLVVLREYAP